MLKALLCTRVETTSPIHNGQSHVYVEQFVPLSSVPDDMCAWRDTDIRAWRSLSKVPTLSAKAVKAIVRSLLSTVVDPDYELPPYEALDLGDKPIDLRPQLCDPKGEDKWIIALGDACATSNSELPNWHWTKRHEIAALPKGFRTHFLWALSLATWEDLELMVAMHESLGLEQNHEVSLAVARMVAVGERTTALWWCDVLADVEEGNRIRAVQAILGAGAQSEMPDDASRHALVAGHWSAASKALAALVEA